MSAREIPRRDPRTARGRVAAPTRHIPENPQALTLRDIPQVLQPPQQQQTARPHLSAPAQQQFSQQAPAVAQPQPQSQQPQPTSQPEVTLTVTDDALARQRAALGFDDIPLVSAEELENEKTLREKASSWAKEAYAHGISTENRGKVTGFFKEKKFLSWKDDLKWALKADKDEVLDEKTVQPVPPQAQPQPQAPPPPLNVTADQNTQRHVRVPARGPQFSAGLREQTRFQQQQPPAQQLTPTATSGTKSIDININFGSLPKLPKLSKLKKYVPDIKPLIGDIRHLKWNRRTQVFSGAMVIFLLFVAPHFLTGADAPADGSTTAANVKTEKISQKPDYQTVTPSGKSADNVNWQRISPPDKNPVFAYADKIDGVDVNVSQQPIPDNFKPDVDSKVADLAKNYNATEKIIAGTTPIYVGTSGTGPQSAIFTKNNLLVLVKTTAKISESSWAKYAQALH